MNNRFFMMLIVALVLAGGAAWLAKNLLEDSLNKNKLSQSLVPVVVAAIDIPYAAKIEATQVKTLGWPKDNVPKGAITDSKLVIGKIAQRAFVADEALLEPQVKDKIAGSILSALIPDGKRALSVRVNDVAGVAGFITPGNMVDIIVTYKVKKENEKEVRRIMAMRKNLLPYDGDQLVVSFVLLSNVKVLAIDQLASPDQDKPAVVKALTLEVTADESTQVVTAMKTGTLYFTLRNPADKENTAETATVPDNSITEPPHQVQKNWPVKSTRTKQPAKPYPTIIDWPTGKKQSDSSQ
jgi:pilus assembly protein CpaB